MSLLIILGFIAIAISINRRLPDNNCNHDCYQGRNCTCQKKDSGQ